MDATDGVMASGNVDAFQDPPRNGLQVNARRTVSTKGVDVVVVVVLLLLLLIPASGRLRGIPDRSH